MAGRVRGRENTYVEIHTIKKMLCQKSKLELVGLLREGVSFLFHFAKLNLFSSGSSLLRETNQDKVPILID